MVMLTALVVLMFTNRTGPRAGHGQHRRSSLLAWLVRNPSGADLISQQGLGSRCFPKLQGSYNHQITGPFFRSSFILAQGAISCFAPGHSRQPLLRGNSLPILYNQLRNYKQSEAALILLSLSSRPLALPCWRRGGDCSLVSWLKLRIDPFV